MRKESERWIVRGQKDYDGEVLVRNIDEGGKNRTIRVGRYKDANAFWDSMSDAEKASTSLGPGRTALLNSGKIKMQDLVGSGPGYKPRTVAELKALAASRS
jgi:hypothetical protein